MLFHPPGKKSRLISLPYTDAAGMVAGDGETAQELLSAALQLADTVGADHLEFRQDGAPPTIFDQCRTGNIWSYIPHYFKSTGR